MSSPEGLLAALILGPLVPAGILTAVTRPWLRVSAVWGGALLIMGLTLATLRTFVGAPSADVLVPSGWLHHAVSAAGLAMSAGLLVACRRLAPRDWWIPAALLGQVVLAVAAESGGDPAAPVRALRVDHLALAMVLVVGLVGPAICLHALGYMTDYHAHHPGLTDRRRSFFALLFAFLFAMFGLVLANDLRWLHAGWEATTLACFLLIRYPGTPEARRNAFVALGLNAVGGLGIAGAMFWQARMAAVPTLELDRLAAMGAGSAAIISAVLVALAGLAKSAQLPASPWLLGAMVAPTPVSALLHSSTMVKAGVYVLLRFAPVFHGHPAGMLVALVGGVTFLVGAFAAVSQANAKRVLAWSTISNLGLIVACAGVGSPAAIWAGMLLLIFHAVAKGLLFIAVGTIEHRTGSRDIEQMEGLLVRWPALGLVVLTGIMGMFLAPFGMLLAKWSTIKALVDASPVLALLVAFGSAPTLFLWTKWMGKVAAVPGGAKRESGGSTVHEWVALGGLATATLLAVTLFPLVSSRLANPHLAEVFGPAAVTVIPPLLIAIMAVMLGSFAIMTAAYLVRSGPPPSATRYLAGLNLPDAGSYRGALGVSRPATVRNYALADLFPERSLLAGGSALAGLLLAVTLGWLPW